MAKLILGDFNAERFWEDDKSVKLPQIKVEDSQRIVMAMEELQVLFCNPGDIIYTRGPMDNKWVEYLRHIGLSCVNRYPNGQCYDYGVSISEVLYNDSMQNGLFEGMEVEPFAVDGYMRKATERSRLTGKIPSEEAVRNVNSKIYSSKMREYLGLRNYAEEVHSLEELENAIKKLGTEADKLILKEEYGVSGQGNLLLQSGNMVKKVVAFIRRQETKGKRINFIIEPYLSKKADFSFQFYISPDGEYKPVSAHEMWNTGLAYKGSRNMENKMRDFLEKLGYFAIMERISARLFQDGYWGDVCIDSMLLEDGSIEPIVEINARKSMGLLKHQADAFLDRFGAVGTLSFLNFHTDDIGAGFSVIAEFLEKNGILFTQESARGIILLSEKAMNINKTENGYQGRVYFLSVEKNRELAELLIEDFKRAMVSLRYNLF